MRAKAPLADHGWCSAQRIKIEMIASGNHTIICAAPVRTLGLRGSELAHSDNPSVMALCETAMTAPFTQGSRGCSRTSAFFDGSRTLVGDCDRRESLERVTPVCALVHNDALYASAYYKKHPLCFFRSTGGVFGDSRRSDKTPETGRFSLKKPGARRRTHSRR